MENDNVRIDKWLWAARFFKTRSLAADAVDRGRVRIGGEPVQPARSVKVDDKIFIDTGSNRCKAPIIYIKANTGETAVRQPGVRGPVRTHGSTPARSASTDARAATPARQSSGSAHSAGE